MYLLWLLLLCCFLFFKMIKCCCCCCCGGGCCFCRLLVFQTRVCSTCEPCSQLTYPDSLGHSKDMKNSTMLWLLFLFIPGSFGMCIINHKPFHSWFFWRIPASHSTRCLRRFWAKKVHPASRIQNIRLYRALGIYTLGSWMLLIVTQSPQPNLYLHPGPHGFSACNPQIGGTACRPQRIRRYNAVATLCHSWFGEKTQEVKVQVWTKLR